MANYFAPASPELADPALGLSLFYVQIYFYFSDFLSPSEIKLKYLLPWLGTWHESLKGQKIRPFCTLVYVVKPLQQKKLSYCDFFFLARCKGHSKHGFGIILKLVISSFCFSRRRRAELIPETLGQRQSNRSADMCSSLCRAVCKGNPCWHLSLRPVTVQTTAPCGTHICE